MFEKCANPDCDRPFDFREGQLVRFRRSASNVRCAANRCVVEVEHFWLCGRCSELYVLERKSESIAMKPRADEFPAGDSRRLVRWRDSLAIHEQEIAPTRPLQEIRE